MARRINPILINFIPILDLSFSLIISFFLFVFWNDFKRLYLQDHISKYIIRFNFNTSRIWQFFYFIYILLLTVYKFISKSICMRTSIRMPLKKIKPRPEIISRRVFSNGYLFNLLSIYGKLYCSHDSLIII